MGFLRRAFPAFLLLLAATVLATACARDSGEPWRLTNITGHLPDLRFALIGDNGETLVAEDLQGKVLMLYFGYAHCPDVCPLALSHLHQVMRELGDEAEEARIVFVTVDPARDTPEILHQYVRAFDSRAIGVTGPMKDVRKLTKAYRVVFDAAPPDAAGNYEVGHSSAVFVFDRSGRARLITTSTDDVPGISTDVRRLIRERT